MAVDRVEKRLRRVAAALDAAGIPYAVVGGNAVATWVARADPSATRATKDVDLLVRRTDVDRITQVLLREDLRDMVLFIDPEEPSRCSGVQLIWAGEKVRPSYLALSPDVTEAIRDSEGFLLLDLPALVRMKLTSFRDLDRVHIADLLEVGLIDQRVRGSLPRDLTERLAEVDRGRDPHG